MTNVSDNLRTVLETAAVVFACFFTIAFLFVAISSMSYPFHLEWMEGQNIDVIQRVHDGLPLYVAPSLDYVPFIYTPLYYYVCGFLSFITGVDFFTGRLVSTLSAIGCGVVLFLWLRKGGNWKIGLMSAGLFFATYRLSGRWFDAARVDSLFLFLTLAGLYVFRFYHQQRHSLLAALLLTAAFFTKQQALLMAAPAVTAGFFLNRKHALLTGGLWIAMIAIGIIIANIVSGGWFSFYTIIVPAGHGLEKAMFLDFWRKDMLRHVGWILALSLLVFAFWQDWRKQLFYEALAVGFIGTAYASRLHWGGWSNVLMPAHAGLALLAGVTLVNCARVEKWKYALPIAFLPVLIQFGLLVYNPWPLIPNEASRQAGERFLREFSAIDGDIFAPELQFVQKRVGKKSYDFGMAGFDVMRSDLGDRNGIKIALSQQLHEAIESRRFSAVMPGRLIHLKEIKGYYQYSRHLEYPREYVTGAINFLRTDIFVRIPSTRE